jgi:post-GPI attachment to proteins factor 3
MHITASIHLAILALVYGSSGDFDPAYQRCLLQCHNTATIDPSHLPAYDLRSYPRYYWWDDDQYCIFSCIKEVSELRRQQRLPAVKYYGHWAFERYLGLEEPASVFFSLANAIPHFRQLRRPVCEGDGYPLAWWVDSYPYIGIMAWLSSAVYHALKTPLTAAWDYSSALVLLSYGLCLAVKRLSIELNGSAYIDSIFNVVLMAVLYQNHRLFLQMVRYDEHMTICISITAITVILWLLWSVIRYLRQPHTRELTWRSISLCISCQLWLVVAAMLEIFDFPPIAMIFDAHSLWHAVTVGLGFLWYHFLESDHRAFLSTNDQADSS